MSVDQNIVETLSEVVACLNSGTQSPIPVSIISALAPLAVPGIRLSIDCEASKKIGAPLIVLVETALRRDVELSLLTARQQQVAALVIEGSSNRQIADKLSISLATVKDHVHAILQRLNMRSRIELITVSRPLS